MTPSYPRHGATVSHGILFPSSNSSDRKEQHVVSLLSQTRPISLNISSFGGGGVVFGGGRGSNLPLSLSLSLGTGQPKEIWWAGLRALNRYLSAADAAAVI